MAFTAKAPAAGCSTVARSQSVKVARISHIVKVASVEKVRRMRDFGAQ
jgi:hypothetical protein